MNNEVSVHLLKILKCRIDVGPELFVGCSTTYLDGCIYSTCADATMETNYTKLLVLNVCSGTERLLDFVHATDETKQFDFGFFIPLPFSLPSEHALGYVRLNGRYFGTKLDFQHQQCHILHRIHCSENFDDDETYPLWYAPWLIVHKKTSTLYQINMNRDNEQFEWKAMRQFRVDDHRDYIHSITSDYLLTTSTSGKYRIQDIRSGQTADLPCCVSEADTTNIAMIQRDNHLQLFFEGKTKHVELITMNKLMVFSENRLLVKLPNDDCDFYGIHDGSLVLGDGRVLQREVALYRIALVKPERLSVLTRAKAQEKAKSRHFAIQSGN